LKAFLPLFLQKSLWSRLILSPFYRQKNICQKPTIIKKMAKQRLGNYSVLSYLKMVHDIHVINPRVSVVKVEKQLENFRKKIPSLKNFFFHSKNISV
jgi:hypothetical protein